MKRVFETHCLWAQVVYRYFGQSGYNGREVRSPPKTLTGAVLENLV